MLTYSDFMKVDIRVGVIERVEDFPEARKPAYKVWVYLGELLGVKQSSAQLTKHYTKEALVGKKILCVINLPEKQIGSFKSQVLILGVPDRENQCILVVPNDSVAVTGGRLF